VEVARADVAAVAGAGSAAPVLKLAPQLEQNAARAELT
jgi:hypothetical protein